MNPSTGSGQAPSAKLRVNKAIIPVAGLGTRFLPLSKVIPKEFFPLDSKPIIQYIVEEAIEAGVKELIFVISPEKKKVFQDYIQKYFREEKKLLSILKTRKKKRALETLKKIPQIQYKYLIQKKPLGDGDAVLRAEKLIKKEPFLVLFGDDIAVGKEKMAWQLVKIFKKIQKPILCLYKMPKEKLSAYGVPKVKKVAERLYQVTGLIEKPKSNPPSSFALVGKYLLTPEIFPYLKKMRARNGEIILLEALKKAIGDKKEICGFWPKGKWLECGDLKKWQKSFLFLAKKK